MLRESIGWSLRSATLIVVLLLANGCTGVAPGSMVSIRPPENWTASIDAIRLRKDDYFRRSLDTPLLAEDVAGFIGLPYWPADPRLYYVGPLHVYAERESFQMITTAGRSRPCERFGWVEFPIDGMPKRLELYRLLDMGSELTAASLLLPFADGTTGKETYPSGRYIDLDGPEGEITITPGPNGSLLAVGPFVLDFNRAFNPSCAYGAPERFACPVTPAVNRLDVRIEAGERGFKMSEAEPAAADDRDAAEG